MGITPLGRKKLVAVPMMAAAMALGAPAAAQAAGASTTGAPLTHDKTVATTVEAPVVGSYGGGSTRRSTGTITRLDDIRGAIA